jgi:hypothetical protein
MLTLEQAREVIWYILCFWVGESTERQHFQTKFQRMFRQTDHFKSGTIHRNEIAHFVRSIQGAERHRLRGGSKDTKLDWQLKQLEDRVWQQMELKGNRMFNVNEAR